jgi:hypothetical protein
MTLPAQPYAPPELKPEVLKNMHCTQQIIAVLKPKCEIGYHRSERQLDVTKRKTLPNSNVAANHRKTVNALTFMRVVKQLTVKMGVTD